MSHPLSVLCATGAHCTACRDRSQTAWRASLAEAFELPFDAPDFECIAAEPRPWGWRRPGDQAAIAPASTAVRSNAEVGELLDQACGPCENFGWDGGVPYCVLVTPECVCTGLWQYIQSGRKCQHAKGDRFELVRLSKPR